MTRTILRLAASVGLTLCLSLVFTPLGCGGSSQGSIEPARAANEGPEVPPGTFSAMRDCVTEAQGRLTDTVYALQFDVEVTASGEVGGVKLRGSFPGESALSACLGHALEGMTLPMSVLQRIPKEKAVSPESRGLTGQVWEELLLVGAGVSLGPIFFTAAAVTVVVGVGVWVTSEASDAVRQRRKIKDRCREMFVRCEDLGPPCTTYLPDCGHSKHSPCGACLDTCVSEAQYTPACRCYSCGFE